MTRGNPGVVDVAPQNNIYTVLVIVAVVVEVIGFAVLFMQAKTVFAPGGLF